MIFNRKTAFEKLTDTLIGVAHGSIEGRRQADRAILAARQEANARREDAMRRYILANKE